MDLRKNEETVVDLIRRAAGHEFSNVKCGAALLIPVVLKGVNQSSQSELVR